MPAFQSSPTLLIAAFLRIARKRTSPVAWVESLQQAALIGTGSAIEAVLNTMQGTMATQLGESGQSSMFLREIPPHQIAEICEAALPVLEAEAADAQAGQTASAASSRVRGFDFGSQPCNLG